jgi:hypothetical protein
MGQQRRLLHVLQHGQIISEDQTSVDILFVVGLVVNVEARSGIATATVRPLHAKPSLSTE